MEINPDEVEIIGSWVMVNGRMTEDDQCHRITFLIDAKLQHVAAAKDGWEKLYRIREMDGFGNSPILTVRCRAADRKRYCLRTPRMHKRNMTSRQICK
jgi:hypothetical protein